MSPIETQLLINLLEEGNPMQFNRCNNMADRAHLVYVDTECCLVTSGLDHNNHAHVASSVVVYFACAPACGRTV